MIPCLSWMEDFAPLQAVEAVEVSISPYLQV